MSEIVDYGLDAAGNKVARGRFVIDPSGHLIVLPVRAPLKNGWRLATQADLDERKAKAAAPTPKPAAAPKDFLGRKSLGNDAVSPPSGPRIERKD